MTRVVKRVRRSASPVPEQSEFDTSMESMSSPDSSPYAVRGSTTTHGADEAYSTSSHGRKRKIEDISEDELSDASAPEARGEAGAEALENSCGIIEKIELQDFMNHRSRNIDFNPNVNFITGANGAGKSAFLHALQVCLGARATSTHRGSKLSDFIRRGSANNEAIVRVTLRNTGREAFKREIYGDRIIIERRIRKTQSSFSIRDCNNREKSTRRSDLAEILDAMNILVDNPVCVLTQEDSKLFLKGNPKKKFDFFMKATELDRIQEAILEMSEMLDAKDSELVRAEAQLPQKEENVRRAEADVREAEVFHETDSKVQRYELQGRWARIRAAEAELDAKKGRLVAVDGEINELKQRLAELEDEERQGRSSVDDLKGVLATSKAKLAEISTRLSEAKQRKAQIVRPLRKDKEILAKRQAERQSIEKQLAAARAMLQREREEARHKASVNQQALMEKVAAVEARLAETVNEEKDIRMKMKERAEHDLQASQQLAAREANLRRARDDLRNDEDDLRRLQRASSNKLGAFGPGVEDLYRAVQENRRRFRGKVVGPIGMHVQLREGMAEWAPTVENALQMHFRTYAVTCREDRVLLQGLERRLRTRMRGGLKVVTLPAAPRWQTTDLDVSGFGCTSIADCVVVDDDMAFNCLLNQSKMDRVVLFADENAVEHSRIVTWRGKSQYIPKAISEIRLRDNTRLVFRGGNLNRIPSYNNRCGGLLSTDNSQQIEEYRRAIEEGRRNLRALQDTVDEARASKQGAASDSPRRHKAQVERLQRERRQLSDQKDAHLRELNETADASRFDTSARDYEITSLSEEIKVAEMDIRDKEDKIQVQEHQLRPLDMEILSIEQEWQGQNGVVNEQLQGLNSIADAQGARARNVADAKRNLPRKEREQMGMREAVQREAAELATSIHALRETEVACFPELREGSLRDESMKSFTYYKKKVEDLLAMKEMLMRKKGLSNANLGELRQRYEHHKKIFDDARNAIGNVKLAVANLKDDIEARKATWKRMRSFMEKETNRAFDRILNQKGHSGQIKLQNDTKELSIKVQKDQGDTETQVSDVRLLSGGERSYSTLALLVGLGRVVECPFRFMDEFDVFMDAVSRKKSMETLLDMARQHPNKQFVFITPQNLNMIKQTSTCKVWFIPKEVSSTQSTLDEFVSAN